MDARELSRRDLLIGSSVIAGLLPLQLESPGLIVPPSVRRPRAGEVSITFDDGPHPVITDYALAILKRKKVTASFFLVGENVKRNANVVRRTGWAGHAVQTHSWDHHRLDTMSEAAIKSSITRTNSAIKSLVGARPTAVRPPYGFTNDRVRDAIADLGMAHVLWNATPSLTMSSASAGLAQVKQHVAIARRQHKGVTVLLHDGSGHQLQMLDLLPRLIDWLRSDGWRFVTIR